ncbi:Aste57867_16813 [Aphanomyces stellatus]|uniref:Aste57867_16813 protein n=1 Tax=Aphanomyces stellatus TaxID=120398 RepID=A0A485L874_9STRA|nr:hypothetical protein As57867_016755 [Aphanomyces stellatus]VFT93578.1 Aste57867_16813 [Aphanomyces stellatus]
MKRSSLFPTSLAIVSTSFGGRQLAAMAMPTKTISLPFQQVYATSTDSAPSYPSAVDYYMLHTKSSSMTHGWLSAKSCSYPQEIGLVLSSRAYVKSIRLVTHSLYAPTKVDIFTGDDTTTTSTATAGTPHELNLYFSTNCQSLCAVEWQCDDATNPAGPIDTRVDVHEPFHVLKLMLDAPRVGSNLYHQVTILDIELLGIPLQSTMSPTMTSLPFVNNMDEKAKRDVQQALLDSGVPLELLGDLIESNQVDAYTAKAIAHAAAVKTACVDGEDYVHAKQLTAHMTILTDVGKHLHALVGLKSDAIAREDYDAALVYHHQVEALQATREAAIAATFQVCQASQVGPIKTDENEPRPPPHEPTTAVDTIFDVAIQRWLREERVVGVGLRGPAANNASSTTTAMPTQSRQDLLDRMFGRVFVACAGCHLWNVRRACVETAEQFVAVLVHVFDIETLYEMYDVLLQRLLADERTIPVALSLLQLVRTVYEQRPSSSPTATTFGTPTVRRGVLRPGIHGTVRAIFHYCCRFNTLLREDCVRTMRFLAQQPHIAELVLESTWALTKEHPPTAFELVLGLKFLQDELQTWSGLRLMQAKDAPPGLWVEMEAFMKRKADDANVDVSGTALEVLALLRAVQLDATVPVLIESASSSSSLLEAHVPLFRRFPFPATEESLLVQQAETYATQANLPTQLRTYVLDAPTLEGFDQFQALKKGTVAFVGTVEARTEDVVEQPAMVVQAYESLPDTATNDGGTTWQESTRVRAVASETTQLNAEHGSVPAAHIPSSRDPVAAAPIALAQPQHTALPADTTSSSPRTHVEHEKRGHPSARIHDAGTGNSTVPTLATTVASLPANSPVGTAEFPPPAVGPLPLVVDKPSTPSKQPKLMAGAKKNQVTPTTAEPNQTQTQSTPQTQVTPRSARQTIDTLQVVAEAAKKFDGVAERKSVVAAGQKQETVPATPPPEDKKGCVVS